MADTPDIRGAHADRMLEGIQLDGIVPPCHSGTPSGSRSGLGCKRGELRKQPFKLTFTVKLILQPD